MKNKTEKKENKTESGFINKYVLLRPHISEKATFLAERGVYVFRVTDKSNKKEIKDEVEKKYKVTVEKVGIVRIPSKKKRVGRIEGKKKSYKKAVVKLKEGQTIDLMLT